MDTTTPAPSASFSAAFMGHPPQDDADRFLMEKAEDMLRQADETNNGTGTDLTVAVEIYKLLRWKLCRVPTWVPAPYPVKGIRNACPTCQRHHDLLMHPVRCACNPLAVHWLCGLCAPKADLDTPVPHKWECSSCYTHRMCLAPKRPPPSRRLAGKRFSGRLIAKGMNIKAQFEASSEAATVLS